MAKKKPAKNQPTADDLKAPLLAAVGAADLALERVNEIVATLRERAGEARTDAEARVEETRARVTKLQEELPTQFGDLRERLTSDELRKFAESYAEAAQTRTTSSSSVARPPSSGCAASRPSKRPPARRAVFGPGRRADPGSAGQRGHADPRGGRACRQAGRRRAAEEGPEGRGPAKKAPAKKAPAKKAPAKKAAAKKVTQK